MTIRRRSPTRAQVIAEAASVRLEADLIRRDISKLRHEIDRAAHELHMFSQLFKESDPDA